MGNAELVREVFDALNQRELDRALANASPDLVMDWSNSIGPASGVYEGRERIREVWASYLEAFESVEWEPQEMIEVDETRVIIVNLARVRGRGSGVEVESRGAQLWTIEDGKAQSFKLFQSKEDALQAVGMAD